MKAAQVRGHKAVGVKKLQQPTALCGGISALSKPSGSEKLADAAVPVCEALAGARKKTGSDHSRDVALIERLNFGQR